MKQIIIILCVISLLSSCRKEWWNPKKVAEPTLPPITAEGKGTFGCLINGKVWVSSAPRAFCNYTPWYYAIRSSLDLYASFYLYGSKNGGKDVVVLGYDSIFGPGVYPLPQPGLINRASGYTFKLNREYTAYNLQSDWPIKTKGSGVLNIHTLDTIKGIIAGTFNFKAINRDNVEDTINITEGRFDIKF